MKCKICNYKGQFEIFNVRELHLGFRDIFEYLYCPAYGCLQIAEIPHNLSKYYPPDYYSFHLQNNRSSIKYLFKDFLKKLRDNYIIHKNKLNFIGYLLSKKFPDLRLQSLGELEKGFIRKDIKILDVGCGEGQFLLQLFRLGFKYLKGIDPYIEKNKEYGRVKIYKTSLLDFNPSNKYDLVMFHHSFEHLVEDPFEVLQKTNNLLNNNSICIIRIPTTSSFAWEYYKENWVQIDAPRHIVIYSVRGIEILARKSGFYIDKIYYDSTKFQFIGSEQYKRDIALYEENSYIVNPKKSIFSRADIKRFEKLANNLNKKFRGDQICVILKRKRRRKVSVHPTVEIVE